MENKYYTGAREGVTLIELLVAVVITVIVGGSIIGAMYSGRSAYQSGAAIVGRHENARAAVDLISRDLQQAAVFPEGRDYWADFSSESDDDGTLISLVFTSFAGRPAQGFELLWIAYRLNWSDGVAVIERAEAQYDEFGFAPATADDPINDIAWVFAELAWDIGNLEFRFFDYVDETDEPRWDYDDTARLPDRVNIRITPAGADEGDYIEASVKMPLSGLEHYL